MSPFWPRMFLVVLAFVAFLFVNRPHETLRFAANSCSPYAGNRRVREHCRPSLYFVLVITKRRGCPRLHN